MMKGEGVDMLVAYQKKHSPMLQTYYTKQHATLKPCTL